MRTHSAAGYKQRDQAHGTLRVVPLGIENSSNRSSPFANPANRKIYVALLVVAIPVLVALYATQNAAFAVAFTIVLLFAVTLVPLAGLCAMMASIPIVNALPPLPIVSSATAVLGAMTFVSVLLRMSKANRDLQRSTRQIYLLIFGLFFSMILKRMNQ